MRIRTTLLLTVLSISTIAAQNGYVKLEDGTVIEGYIRFEISSDNGERFIELWKTKKDKNPERYEYCELIEYGHNKNIVRILKNFYPYEDKDEPFYECVEAPVLSRGKIDLLILHDHTQFKIANVTGGGLIPTAVDHSMGNSGILYVLFDNSTNYARAVEKKDKFYASIKEFIEDDYSLLRSIYLKEFKYRHIRKIVDMYNDNVDLENGEHP